MRKKVFVAVAIGWLVAFSVAAGDRGGAEEAIDGVLNSFHQAASDADGALYFSLFAEDAVFIGTDATERWSVEEFKTFAEPYFSKGRGWTYTKTQRHVIWNMPWNGCGGADREWLAHRPVPSDLSNTQ